MLKTSKPVFYVTPDVSRAIGLETLWPNYHVVCLDDHPLVDYLQQEGFSVFCLARQVKLKATFRRESGSILAQPLVLDFIRRQSGSHRPNIIFFKPQDKIEYLARKLHFNLIGNSAKVNRIFEDKTSFFRLCRQNNITVPAGEVGYLGQLSYPELCRKYGERLVVQFGRGWAGSTTYFVSQEADWKKLPSGNFRVKVTPRIIGPTLITNAVIYGTRVLVGPPAIQIEVTEDLSARETATGGRQWPAPISLSQQLRLAEVTQTVGLLMGRWGYQGFFGLDFLLDDQTGAIYLSENNARLTASTPFFTQMEIRQGRVPLLLYHLLAFMPSQRLAASWLKARGDDELRGSEIVGRNNLPTPILVKKSVHPGVYDSSLRLVRRSYYLNQNSTAGEFWLTAAPPGRLIESEAELFKINTHQAVCQRNGRLTPNYQRLVHRVKAQVIHSTEEG